MRGRGGQLIVLVAAVALACGLLAATASAAAIDAPPMAGLFDFLNPIKNIAELVTKIVGKLFGALAKVLMPDFLRDASVKTLKGLVSVPNLSNARQWHNVGELRSGTTAIAWALLPLPFTLAAVRYLVGTFTDGPHPIMSVVRLVGAAFGLVAYPWAAGQAFALINVTTNALLSLPAVGNGLQRAVTVLFGAAIIAGVASPFLACLALVAIVMGTLLFGLKIAIVMIAALLYVTGPLVIALATLPETAHLYRAWLFAFIALAFIPVGWCLIFAVAGALTLDATSGGISMGLIAKDVTAALAALLAFGLAVLWPKFLIGHALQVASGLGLNLRGAGNPTNVRAPTSPNQAHAAVRQLRDGTQLVGRGVGRAIGHAGASVGGGVGWAGRLMGRGVPAAVGIAGQAGGALGRRATQIRTRAAAELSELSARLQKHSDDDTPTDNAPDGVVRATSPQPHEQAPAGQAAGARSSTAPSQRGERLSAEQRAVLDQLSDKSPPRVRRAVIHARPGHAARAATRAAERAHAPLSPQARRAIFAAAADATPPAASPASSPPETGPARTVPGATPPPSSPDRPASTPPTESPVPRRPDPPTPPTRTPPRTPTQPPPAPPHQRPEPPQAPNSDEPQ